MDEKIDHIITFLNTITGLDYKLKTVKTRKLVIARLNDGYRLGDFEDVIKHKNTEWKGTMMAQYLRPETLFGTKFEGYLQASRMGGPESKFAKATREMQEGNDKINKIFNDGSN